MLNTITLFSIGFSIIIAALLFLSYWLFIKSNNKTIASIFSCAVLLIGLSALQLHHYAFLIQQTSPLESIQYRFLLFLVPPSFYFFSRFVLFPDYKFQLKSSIHLLPLIIVFFVSRNIAVPLAFLIGAGYCFWLTKIIYNLRQHRKRFQIEFFFFAFFSLFAIAVLILGYSVSIIDDQYFYFFYSNGIGLAYILVTAALIIYPDLLNELTDAVTLSYSQSTLSNVDIETQLKKLNQLMHSANLYQNENLNLSLTAESMDISSHQLSELINTNYAVGFSRYIRELRVEQAKVLLKNEPDVSILSISMETGFKSQSNFYAAFKEITGISPGSYRKQL
jgi:AraC-like DNA-binding protein